MTATAAPAAPADDTQKLNNYVISVIRTGVPTLVGAGCAYLAAKGLHIPASDQAAVDPLLTAAAGTLYYSAVRAAEKRWPKLGLLLGWIAQVAYSKPAQ